jgi:hypothetical protein
MLVYISYQLSSQFFETLDNHLEHFHILEVNTVQLCEKELVESLVHKVKIEIASAISLMACMSASFISTPIPEMFLQCFLLYRK